MVNGERIKELMKEQGITNKELAEAVGVTEAMISYILRGQRDTTVRVIAHIASRLRGTVNDIVSM